MSMKNFEFIFNPKRIAVVGAADDKKSTGYHLFHNLVGKGFQGIVHPVSAASQGIQGVEAYKNIRDIPHPVDLAILTVPIEHIPEALEDCGQKEVKGVIIMTPNYEFRIENSEELAEQIVKISRIYGFRVLGPNSFGFLRPSRNLNASLYPVMPERGSIAFVAQSAIFSSAFLERAVSKNVGFSYFISLGAKIDIDISDLIDFLGIDPETKAIVLYVSSIKNGKKFMTAVRSYAGSKPIVVIKPGKDDNPQEAANTLAGRLTVKDKIYDAAFKRSGAVRVDEMLDLFYMTETLAKQRRPKGRKLAVMTNALGPSLMAVDALRRLGGELTSLSGQTSESLIGRLSCRVRVENPLYLPADAAAGEYETVITALLKDPGTDGLLVIYVPFPGEDPALIAAATAKASAANKNIPVFTVWLGVGQVEEARDIFESHGIPTFVTPEQAAKSFIYAFSYDYNLRMLHETPELLLKDFVPDFRRAKAIIEKAASERRLVLHLHEAKELLECYGIPMVQTLKAASEEGAAELALTVGYPAVLKIDSEKVLRKLSKGGVLLNLGSEEAVREAYRTINRLAHEVQDPEANVVLQPMIVKHGYEIAIGAKKDSTFGSVILFGTGGELTEAVKDYAIGLPPLNQTLARRMMEETMIYRYLSELPNAQNLLHRLEVVLVRFSELVSDFYSIFEIEINPFLLSDTDGIALDVSVVLDERVLKDHSGFKPGLCPPHLCICPYPFRYEKPVVLKDGRACLVRPVKAEDEPLIYELFKSLSEETIMLRFCQRLVDMPHERLVRYCQIDYDREQAFVASVTDESGKETLIGDVRIIKMPDLESGELAILVGDDWQGLGIGRILMEYALQIAREIGLKSLWMEILVTNTRMRRVGEKFGFRQAYIDEDMVKVVLRL